MDIAISLWFDQDLETSVRRIWADLAREGISSIMHDGPYRPHVTLGVWREVDHNRVITSLERLLLNQATFPVRFKSIGNFPGEEGVTFLHPIVTTELLTIHNSVHTLMENVSSNTVPNYLPDSWVPHCTLVFRTQRQDQLACSGYLLDNWHQLYGEICAVGIIEIPAEIELYRIELA